MEKRYPGGTDGAVDEATAALICQDALRKALNALYAKSRRWQEATKRVLADLESFAPDLAPMFRRALRSGPGQPAETIAVLDRVLKEFGGRFEFTQK